MRARTLGGWVGRMVAVAAVSAGASVGTALAAGAEPNDLGTVVEAPPATDDQETSPDAHEWQ